MDTLKSNLKIKLPKGSNLVIITHSFPEGIGLGQIANMETVVIMHLGQCYQIIDILSLRELINLQIDWREKINCHG